MNETRTEPTLQDLPALEVSEPDDDQVPPATSRRSHRRRIRWLAAILALLAVVALVSVLWQPRPILPPPAVAPRAQSPSPAETTKPRYPIEATAAALPPLDASDSTVLAALQQLWQGGGIAPFLEPRSLVRNIVATVDNLPRRSVPRNRWPLRPAAGAFGTSSTAAGTVIGDANALRYTPYVRLLDSADPIRLVALYARHYPLFDQAYRELGYPQGHFNDRLVEAIDVMLATPEAPAPVRLVQPKVFYEFADRDLEMLPSGQKIMLRVGSDNAKVVRARLVEIRRILTAEPSGPTAATTRN